MGLLTLCCCSGGTWNVELPSRSASQWPAPIRRYTAIHDDTHAHTHKHAQQAGCGSVTHFELYRTKSFVFFFTEQTHNKTRDEEHNKQQEQQLKAARRCEDARTEGLTIHSARDNWTLAVWSTLTTWRNAASLVSTN